jgi:hypothetical protein
MGMQRSGMSVAPDFEQCQRDQDGPLGAHNDATAVCAIQENVALIEQVL